MDIKEPSRVLLQGNGTFNLEEEVAEEAVRMGDGLGFWEPCALLRLCIPWIGYVSSES